MIGTAQKVRAELRSYSHDYFPDELKFIILQQTENEKLSPCPAGINLQLHFPLPLLCKAQQAIDVSINSLIFFILLESGK